MRRLAVSMFTVTVLACSVPVHAREAQPANAQQMSEIAGDYRLSDGRRLQIDFDGTDVYIQMDKQGRQHLQGTSDGHFKSADGTLTVRSRIDAAGTTLEVAIRGRQLALLR